ncbi:MAG TPA: 3'(2'),5'-bisphosphate nucleotidase CysQ [Bauldia sp.]|nr:3'(2'),5'-bisphosphate nucleotidase CysQ [Bauldia sp.]
MSLLSSDTELAEAMVAAAIAAGAAILAARARGLTVESKADTSPVTEADRAAEAVILRHLAEAAPGIPVVAEEACAVGRPPSVGAAFFLVDALDGTREFVRGGDDFTVNIALVRNETPAIGVVLAPVTGEIYVGVAGSGAWRGVVRDGVVVHRRAVTVRSPGDRIDVVASRSHRTPETDAYIARYRVGANVAAGSSLKFCTVADGRADLYPRMGTTMQWDTAAGDAVLRAAGGRTLTLDNRPLRYGPTALAGADSYRNPWFVAVGKLQPILGG